MQVLLCDQLIGWRKGTSHVIVFITDAVLHVAGEGVLGGAWQPYQHACQLVEREGGTTWVYNSLEHDYPSIAGMLLIKKNNTERGMYLKTPLNPTAGVSILMPRLKINNRLASSLIRSPYL
jgi:hypothetical protein